MKTKQKHVLFPISMVLVLTLLIGAFGPVRAQTQSPVAPPLYGQLTWTNTSIENQNLFVNGQYITLPGLVYTAVGAYNGDLDNGLIEYYSVDHMAQIGWAAVSGSTGSNVISSAYYHSSGRYLVVQITPCNDANNSTCIQLWVSLSSLTVPIPTVSALPNPPTPSFSMPIVLSFVFNVHDPLWANDSVGNVNSSNCDTMANTGTAVAAYAMLYDQYGTTYTPQTLNNLVSSSNSYLYNYGCDNAWNHTSPPFAPQGVSYYETLFNVGPCKGHVSCLDNLLDQDLTTFLTSGRPVVAQIYQYPNKDAKRYVVMEGDESTGYNIADPFDGSRTTLSDAGYVVEALHFYRDPAFPPTFSKFSPTNGATIFFNGNSAHVLNWTTEHGDAKYYYCIDQIDDQQCNATWWYRKNPYSDEGQFTLVPGQTYYWQVKEVLADNTTVNYANNGVWWSLTVLQSAPQVTSINLANVNPVTNTTDDIQYSVEFSQPVSGVDISDFGLYTSGDVTGASVIGVSGSEKTYAVTVSPGEGDGTIELDLYDNDTIVNNYGVPLGGVGVGNGNSSGETCTIDRTSPHVTSSEYISTYTPGQDDYYITFSEAVSGIDASDFALAKTGEVNGETISSVSIVTPSVYRVRVNTGGLGRGYLGVNVIDNDSIKDQASNPLGGADGSGNGNFVGTLHYKATFADVPTNYWAWGHIEAIYRYGITAGCGGANYCPEASITRDQMAIFILRGEHGSSYVPPAVGSSTGFADVPITHWAAAWIKQLAAEGITSGCAVGYYCPGANVTRDSMAIFLLRAKHGSSYIPPAVGTSTGFTDVPTTHWAAAWIKQLAAEGISAGCSANLYCPNDITNRASMAVFLAKTFNIPVPPVP